MSFAELLRRRRRSSGNPPRALHDFASARSSRATSSQPWMRVPELCDHVHLPVQSGSTRILRAMQRTYTREEYLEKIAMIRAARRPISVTSDIIVGFPGETEADFEETLCCSMPRSTTASSRFNIRRGPIRPPRNMPDAIPEEEKSRRLAVLHGTPARNSDRAQRSAGRPNVRSAGGRRLAPRKSVVGPHFQQPHCKFHFAARRIFWENMFKCRLRSAGPEQSCRASTCV